MRLTSSFFETLRRTRHTSFVLFSGGIHGVFFNCDVDQARAHHATPPAAPETTRLMTDDRSRPLSPSEITTLTTEVDTLVASLQLPAPTAPLVPRAPGMLDGDPRSDAEADDAWQSSSTILLPSTVVPSTLPMHGPRNLHPYMRSNDATAYYYSVPIRSTLPEPPHPDD
jgi:hypothetical protein